MNYRTYIFTALAVLLLSGLVPHLGPAQAQEPAAESVPADQPASNDARPGSVEAVFTNPTPINITVGGPVMAGPYPSSIAVTGLTGLIPFTPGSVRVTLNSLSHNRPSDLGIVLVSPWGGAMLIQDGAGGPVASISNVTYTLSDTGATQLPNGPWTAGTYRPTGYFVGDSFPAPGPLTAYANPGPVLAPGATVGATFASTFGGTNPNGTWKLFVYDFVNTAGGSFAGGWTLEINGGSTRHRAVLDFDGDNRTDDTWVHDLGGGNQWAMLRSSAGPGALPSGVPWGLVTDQLVPEEYDGDGKTDVAVFRLGVFYILRSSSNTLQVISYGTAGDDATVTQDFDNDGLADPAVTRNVSGNIDWYVLGVMSRRFGLSSVDVPIRGDFNGDGKADLAVYRTHLGSPANTFIVQPGLPPPIMQPFGNFQWDYIVPGDFDNDGKTDFAVYRGVGPTASGVWYWLRSSDLVLGAQPWGAPGDLPVPGDYNGDLQTDQAVWRSGTPGTFYHLSGGLTISSGGTSGDRLPAFTLQVR